MPPEPPSAVEIAHTEIVPHLETLCVLLESEGEMAQLEFFGRILAALRHAKEDEDLAGAFLELATSAFRGFVYSMPATLVIDRVLEAAETLSATLSASGDAPH